jgi:hypothetical protein
MKRAMKDNKGLVPPNMRVNRHVVGMYEWVMADVAKEVSILVKLSSMHASVQVHCKSP